MEPDHPLPSDQQVPPAVPAAAPPRAEPGAMPVAAAGEPPFDLPGARQIVGRGFDLGLASSGLIRRASIYVALLSAAFAVPVLLQGAVLALALPDELRGLLDGVANPSSAPQGPLDPRASTAMLLLWIVLALSAIAISAVMIDAQVMAFSLLAGRLVGRPMALHEALRRARQVFWRMVMVALLVSLPLGVTQALLADLVVRAGIPDQGAAILAGIAVALLGAPFGYVPAGIILGDVDPGQAVVRSIRLARTRWRLALVIALFATVFAWVEVLALGVGIDLLARLGEPVGLGFDGILSTFVTLLLLLAGVAGAMSLVFTFGALTAAPQVVAFVGLTHFHAGLDRARDPAGVPPAGPAEAPDAASRASTAWAAVDGRRDRFRWVTLPMTALLVLEIALGLSGLAAVIVPPA